MGVGCSYVVWVWVWVWVSLGLCLWRFLGAESFWEPLPGGTEACANPRNGAKRG